MKGTDADEVLTRYRQIIETITSENHTDTDEIFIYQMLTGRLPPISRRIALDPGLFDEFPTTSQPWTLLSCLRLDGGGVNT